MPIIADIHKWLSKNARGKWFETSRFKNKDTGEYLHKIERNMILARVEIDSDERIIRAFYWLYSIEDAMKLNEFVSHNMKSEVHEVILSTKTRFFIDFDLKVDSTLFQIYGLQQNQKNLDNIGFNIATLLNQLFLCSLQEHGIDTETEMETYDWMFTMRNREDKLSIHFITNILISLEHSMAISTDMKKIIIQDPSQFDIDNQMATIVHDSIDTTQYRHHGSLSLPFGIKRGKYVNRIKKQYDSPNQLYFITIPDSTTIRNADLSQYGVIQRKVQSYAADQEFVNKALEQIHLIPDYSKECWDLESSKLKGSTMYLRRMEPSYCSVCDRTHDSDNTLFIMFNSDIGIASWKCARAFEEKPKIFYRERKIQEPNIDEFLEQNKHLLQTKKKQNDETNISVEKYRINNIEDMEEPIDYHALNEMKIHKKKHALIAAGKQETKSIFVDPTTIENKDEEEPI